jgi:hypothetical protein
MLARLLLFRFLVDVYRQAIGVEGELALPIVRAFQVERWCRPSWLCWCCHPCRSRRFHDEVEGRTTEFTLIRTLLGRPSRIA